MKKSALVVAIVLVATAVNPVSAETLSDEKAGIISTNCASLKFQLKRIQKESAKSRVHLGAQYESIATNLMMNLNLRLVKNNRANADIASQQTTFISERDRFKNDFIGYSQQLEALINIDCKAEPQKFYDQLENTRAKRSDVDASIRRLNEILDHHRDSLNKLREELE